MDFTHLQQCSSYTKGDCLGLPRKTTTMGLDKHIIALFISQDHQWDCAILNPQWIPLKIFLGVTVIDDDFAGSFLKNDTSNCTFPTTGAKNLLSSETARKPGLDVLLEISELQIGGRSSGGLKSGGGGDDNEARGFGNVGKRSGC